MLIIHIIIAFTGLIAAGAANLKPNRRLITASYGLSLATLTTGALLIAVGYSALHVCLAGAAYTALALLMNVTARRRLLVRATM